VTARIGKRGQYRLLRCRTCKGRFSERRGTVFFGSHMPAAKVVSILAHVQEGCGMRQTGRLVGTKEDTVIRYARLAGRHAAALHDELVAFPPATQELQFDEKWAFVQTLRLRSGGGEPRPRRPCRR
jgi:hypothetical protein